MFNENRIIDALLDWNLWGHFKEDIKNREITVKPSKNIISVIKGVRRSGKTMLTYLTAKNYPKEKTLFINFEDPRLQDIKSDDIIKIVEIYQKFLNKGLPDLLVLDEVQNIKGWEKVARLYTESKKINVLVTGSSSKLMSEEYSSILSGRHLDLELFPLSFREILNWNNIDTSSILEIYKNKIEVTRTLDYYIKFGGFPRTVLEENETKKLNLLRQYFNDIIQRDVVIRYKIKNIEKLEALAKIYLSNISTIQSFNKLRKILNISLDTVERFTRYFEIARLFITLSKFSYSVKNQIISPRKVYCIDTGLYNALGFKFSENIGRLMENLVYIELLRQKSYFNPNMEIYYYKDYQGYEIDFLVKEGIEVKELIQVTYATDFDEISPREYRALIKASELFKGTRLTIITWDYEDQRVLEWWGRKAKIDFVPLWKWLLKI